MKLNSKTYKTNKIKNYIKTNSLFFFFNGINKQSNDWILTEQELKNIHFDYYKIFNKTTSKTFNDSIYKNFKFIANGITFFVKPSSTTSVVKKHVLLNNFESLLFKLVSIKLNNKIYSTKQLDKLYSMNYVNNKLLLYQFGITNLKTHFFKKSD